MAEKYLHLDNMTPAACISPVELAVQNQEFLIYNPSGSTYLSVSLSSPKLKEQESCFVETSDDIRGLQKCFKLKDCGDGSYNILTINENGDENGFLYLSESVQSGIFHHSNNVLKSTEIVDGKENLYTFERIVHRESDGDWQQFFSSKEEKSDVVTYKNNDPQISNVRLSLRDKKFFIAKGSEEDANHGDNCFPSNPIAVEPSDKVSIQLSLLFTTYMKLNKMKITTEDGRIFSALTEQTCFHKSLELKLLN